MVGAQNPQLMRVFVCMVSGEGRRLKRLLCVLLVTDDASVVSVYHDMYTAVGRAMRSRVEHGIQLMLRRRGSFLAIHPYNLIWYLAFRDPNRKMLDEFHVSDFNCLQLI